MTQIQFNQQYDSNFNAMMNFAQKLTKDMNEAQELVQIASVKAYRGFHTFKAGTSFKSWVFTIIKNSFITGYNKKRRKNTVKTSVEDMQFAVDKKFAINNAGESNMRLKEIEKCIELLSYKSKLPFLMHIEGYQYNEISEALNIPMGTVKSRINFARTKLKGHLIEKGIVAA